MNGDHEKWDGYLKEFTTNYVSYLWGYDWENGSFNKGSYILLLGK